MEGMKTQASSISKKNMQAARSAGAKTRRGEPAWCVLAAAIRQWGKHQGLRPDSKGTTSQVRNWDNAGILLNKSVSHYGIKVHIFRSLEDSAQGTTWNPTMRVQV